MQNTNLSITKEWLAHHYGKKESDITCVLCSFSDAHSLNLDKHTMWCTYWKTEVKCSAFCSHYGCFKVKGGKNG